VLSLYRLALNCDPPISASQVVGTTDVHHHASLYFHSIVCVTGNWTQGLTHARQVLSTWAVPSSKFVISIYFSFFTDNEDNISPYLLNEWVYVNVSVLVKFLSPWQNTCDNQCEGRKDLFWLTFGESVLGSLALLFPTI
jgi:hypothetical protein